MPLTLTEDETMLVDSVKGFLARSSPVSAFRALRDTDDPLHYSPALWAEMMEMGLGGLLIPEDQGGAGFGYSGAGLVAEQAGHVLAASPFLSSMLAIEILQRDGSAEQKALIPSITDGSLLVGFAIDEKAKHDPDAALSTRAAAAGNGFVLDGSKRMVVDGGNATKLIVAASTDAGPTLLLLDAKEAGVTVKPLKLIDSRDAADIDFAGVKLDADAVIGTAGGAGETIARALDVGRALLAAELLGISQEAYDRTVAYLKEREQFGQKIGSFQALQHRASRLYTRMELARGVVMKALRALDQNDSQASLLVSLAKFVMVRTGRLALDEAVQMHGGIGVTDDIDIGFFLKRGRVAAETFGDDRFHKERLARLALGI